MLKRILKIPLAILTAIYLVTIIAPLTYWIITGNDPIMKSFTWLDKI